jgi:predicted DsbA family dithiol-disulfide isomerase
MTPAITIFSDFASAYSYLAESSLRRLRGGPAIRYRAVPSAGGPLASDGEEWNRLVEVAVEQGIELRLPRELPRTGKAHEAALFARGHGREEVLREAVFRAFWRDHSDIARIDVLCEIVSSIGLDPEDLKIALDIDLHAEAVAADALLATRLGIREPPVTYFGSGAEARVVTGAFTSNQLQALLPSDSAFTQAGDHG